MASRLAGTQFRQAHSGATPARTSDSNPQPLAQAYAHSVPSSRMNPSPGPKLQRRPSSTQTSSIYPAPQGPRRPFKIIASVLRPHLPSTRPVENADGTAGVDEIEELEKLPLEPSPEIRPLTTSARTDKPFQILWAHFRGGPQIIPRSDTWPPP